MKIQWQVNLRLLVYRLNFLRQSGGNNRAFVKRHFRRHRSVIRSGVYSCPDSRCGRGEPSHLLAINRAEKLLNCDGAELIAPAVQSSFRDYAASLLISPDALGIPCQEPSWIENTELSRDLAIEYENIG